MMSQENTMPAIRILNATEARADRQHGDKVWDDETKWNFAKPRASSAILADLMLAVDAWLWRWLVHRTLSLMCHQPRRLMTAPLAEPNSARTVSPAIAV